MRRLVVCADGTWNTADQEQDGLPTPTNVVRLHHAVLARGSDGTGQLRYYHPGVGTEGGVVARLAGGALGAGLVQNIKSAYGWLARAYTPGDEVFLFGFSRGAYTVRSLVGMLGGGLLQLGEDDAEQGWQRVDEAFARYRGGGHGPLSGPVHHDGAPLPVRFLGVWDTVGALGIPDDLALLNLLDDPRRWAFHDTTLGGHVLAARHAIAIDEARSSFTPTRWTGVATDRDVEQLWFAGSHTDVGGGRAETGLSDVSLAWMFEAAAGAGLGLHAGMRAQLRPNPSAPSYDSHRGIFRALRTRPRQLPPIEEGVPELHGSVLQRKHNPPIAQGDYHDTRRLSPDERAELPVYAAERWCRTGLYLDAGRYRLQAHGQWLDASVPCGPGGMDDGHFHVGELAHVIGNAIGLLERGVRRVTHNADADLKGTRRVESMPWFSLIGVIANEAHNPAEDGSPDPHEHFLIGDGCEHTLQRPGYLYAFANDAWDFYENNRGSITLTITRLE